MPRVVEVPGVGNVEFPDSMSDQDISAHIQKNNPVQTGHSQTAAEHFGVTNPIGKGLLDAVEGIGAGVMSTARGASQLAHKVVPAIPELPASYAEAPQSIPGKVGKFGEQAAEFAAPMGAVSKATQGAKLLLRMAAEGLTSGAVGALQSGGDPKAAGSAAVAGVAGPAIGAAAGGIASKVGLTPEKMYQSALKPTWSMVKKDGLSMVDTGLKEKIPVSHEGLTKVEGLIDDLGKQIKEGVSTRALQGKTIDTSKVLSRLDDLEKFYQQTAAPEGALKSIAGLRLEFEQYHGQKLPLDVAQQIKTNTYQVIKDSYGEMKAAKIEGLKQVARGLKEEISSVFPEISGLNERQSKLLGLDDAMYRALARIDNHQLGGIGSPIAATAGKAVMGGPGAMAGLVGKMLLDDPKLKSKLAIALANRGVSGAGAVVNSRMAAFKAAVQESATKLGAGQDSPALAAENDPSANSGLSASVRAVR